VIALHEFVGRVDVEAVLVVVEFDVVGDHRAERRVGAGRDEEEVEQLGVGRLDLARQLRLRRDGDRGCGGCCCGSEESDHGVLVM